MLCIASLTFLVFRLTVASAEAIDCTPSSQSFTIKTSQDVSDITTCATFTGSVVVAADGPEEISLDGITSISGNLDVENVAQLRSLSSQSLTAVSSFTLNHLPNLSNLSFPSLANFSSIKWYTLPALEVAGITAGQVDNEVQEISIFNTSIKSLDWITWPLGSLLNVTSNVNLQSFSIPYGTINAGSTLAFSDNAVLENFTVSQLAGIYGALQVSENPQIASLAFENLETIGGYVQLSGDYKNVSMPALSQVNGALNVDSTSDISSFCAGLDQKADSRVLKGHYDCTANSQKNPTSPSASATSIVAPVVPTATPTNQPSASGDNNGNLTNGAKIAIGVLIPLVAIVSSILTCLCYRRRLRSKVQEIEKSAKEDPDATESTEPDTVYPELKELESPRARVEMGSGREMQEMEAGEQPKELDARHGKSELETPITPLTPAESWYSDTPLMRHELPA